MTYPESIKYLYGLRLFGLKLGLENTRKLAALAGNPQERLRFIHIAGTNGKGSVAAMLEGIYRASGLRVGLYISPHLISFRERIQVDRQPIREEDVVRLVTRLWELSGMSAAASDRTRPSQGRGNGAAIPLGEHRPEACATFFEFVTVMALRYFAERQCDLVIWETGLGGRLDATNIVNPLASVITNVEPDHQRWLGHDLKSIATEKAGIIKSGVPTITAATAPEALAVIRETARERSSPLTLVTAKHALHTPLPEVQLPLPGWHQRMNAATALATVQTLQARLPVGGAAIRSGLESVNWPGRLQLIETKKGRRILLDGAHNNAAATSLAAFLEEALKDRPIALILGIFQDKDWESMCQVLAPLADRIFCVPVRSDRGTPPDKLAAACRSANNAAEVRAEASAAVALERTAEAALTVVSGSIYLVGEALEALRPDERPATDERGLNDWTTSSNVPPSRCGPGSGP